MKNLHLGLIGCLMAMMLMLLGCSADGSQTTSVERLRELLAQAQAGQVSTGPSEYEKETDKKPSEPYEGYLGYLPNYYYGDLTEAEKRGLQTWYFWLTFHGILEREEWFSNVTREP